MKGNRGLIQVYTGDGKGKTTAAIGLAVRALGWGKKVAFIQFIKGYKEIGERRFFKKQKGIVIRQFHRDVQCAIGRPTKAHKISAQKAWNFTQAIIKKGDCDLLILDEINNAIYHKLIDVKEVIKTLKNKPKHLEIVLTGRHGHPRIIALADLVAEMKKIKHPFDKGLRARKGIEY